jgi:hypothetical protein
VQWGNGAAGLRASCARAYTGTHDVTRESGLSGPGPGTRPREAGLKYLAVSHGLSGPQ